MDRGRERDLGTHHKRGMTEIIAGSWLEGLGKGAALLLVEGEKRKGTGL